MGDLAICANNSLLCPNTSLSNSSGSIQSVVMHAVAPLLLLGSYAVQAVLGRPDATHTNKWVKRSVDSFIATESPIALSRVLCNIGATGCYAEGVSSGLVLASPSQNNPNYYYTWTRDSALTFACLTDIFINGYNATLQQEIENYIKAQTVIQGIPNPSGSLSDGAGLAEPKFEVNETAFTGAWGRPQRDGPALRAITLMNYAQWLVDNGYSSTASSIIWPIVQNDLAYVAQYWNQTGFDLWEEVDSTSFFTVANQHRALVQGSAMAATLGTSCPACSAVAPSILCHLQDFWAPSEGYIIANLNYNSRSGKDANTVLGSIHTFDPSAGCDATTFQPCSDKALANHKVLTDSFRSIYAINSGIPEGTAVSVGRYPEDVYYGGNPWYLNTLAAAEQLYDALYVWKAQGSITVTSTSLAFFQDFDASVTAGTYASSSSTYTTLYNAISTYADGYMNIVGTYVQANGSLSEQFLRSSGEPTSAYDLTWSYAAFLTAAARRAGVVPASWNAPAGDTLPSSCAVPSSVVGSYATATDTAFPASQTPSTRTASATTSSATGCATASTVLVTFDELAATSYGQSIEIVGDVAALGNWNTGDAVALSAYEYTSSNPLWSVTVALPAGEVIEYKYINVQNGAVTWEADPNHTYTVPVSCATAATVSNTWQS